MISAKSHSIAQMIGHSNFIFIDMQLLQKIVNEAQLTDVVW